MDSRKTSSRLPSLRAVEEVLPMYAPRMQLGAGSFGRVFLMEHRQTGGKVAVKTLKKERIVELGMQDKVRREISILLRVRHPNVIRLYNVVETPKYILLLMEYAENGELFDYITQRGRLTEGEARRIFQQIVAGVEYCHRRMVVHRDLKPENILLDASWTVKIADFGLGNLMTEGHFLRTSCGSPNYAAPEVGLSLLPASLLLSVYPPLSSPLSPPLSSPLSSPLPSTLLSALSSILPTPLPSPLPSSLPSPVPSPVPSPPSLLSPRLSPHSCFSRRTPPLTPHLLRLPIISPSVDYQLHCGPEVDVWGCGGVPHPIHLSTALSSVPLSARRSSLVVSTSSQRWTCGVISGRFYCGPEVDVWGCGVVLYTLLCGRLPFDEKSHVALYQKIKAGAYSRPTHVTPAVQDLLARLLVVDPTMRATIPEIRRHPWFLPWFLPSDLIRLQEDTAAGRPAAPLQLNATAISNLQAVRVTGEGRAVLAGNWVQEAFAARFAGAGAAEGAMDGRRAAITADMGQGELDPCRSTLSGLPY
ncbi:unnamed protein product [Closterium sp. NIES-65]|nr:unnamed protein product [Closterium sp. NIES-65]